MKLLLSSILCNECLQIRSPRVGIKSFSISIFMQFQLHVIVKIAEKSGLFLDFLRIHTVERLQVDNSENLVQLECPTEKSYYSKRMQNLSQHKLLQ